eukprot:m.1104096 g.1104096  ORF g.1104096 m.1104096 type:complete len:237 (+) comp24335_c0_seq25:169-879(+)
MVAPVMVLPMFKLLYVFTRQISKPVAKMVERSAKSGSGTIRNKIVIPLGQFSHWVSVRAERVCSWYTICRATELQMYVTTHLRFITSPVCTLLHAAETLKAMDAWPLQRVIAGNTRTRVRSLSEEEAIEWGGSLIGETFIYSVAAGFVIYEYTDKEAKDSKKKEEIQAWRNSIGEQVLQLQEKIQQLETESTELRQALEAVSQSAPASEALSTPATSNLYSAVSYGLSLVGLGSGS